MENFFSFIARLFLASIFFIGVILLLNTLLKTPDGYSIYQDMLGARGVPGIFAPISVVVQFVFGLTLILGYKTKLSAYVLSAYSLIWSLIYLFNTLSGQPLMLQVLQYLAITGGLLHLAINSETSYSLDNLCAAKKKK
jgi:putative oxidoreductase